MSDITTENGLTFDRADRMRKSLRVSGVSVHEMAEYLGVTRGTVSTWINGHIAPSVQTLMLWAMRTGVPFEWLTDGLDTTAAYPCPKARPRWRRSRAFTRAGAILKRRRAA